MSYGAPLHAVSGLLHGHQRSPARADAVAQLREPARREDWIDRAHVHRGLACCDCALLRRRWTRTGRRRESRLLFAAFGGVGLPRTRVGGALHRTAHPHLPPTPRDASIERSMATRPRHAPASRVGPSPAHHPRASLLSTPPLSSFSRASRQCQPLRTTSTSPRLSAARH